MGLNDEEVLKSREKYGTNEIVGQKKLSFLKQYISTLGDPIIRILLIALAIKTVFLIRQFDWYETIGIVIAIFLASFISTISEYGSEKAFEKLQEESSKINCRALRNGKLVEIKIDDVVVGDIISLEAGDKIPADGVIIEGMVNVDESSITGEAKEILKKFNDNLFRGTIVYSKKAKMKVTKVGINTFYGEISRQLQEKQPDSPLKVRLRKLAELISKIGYIGAALVFFSHLFSVIVIDNNFSLNLIKDTITNIPLLIGHILYGLTLCVTIIIVAVPEGLPMMITLVLSSNMKRLLKNNVLVRKLMGIETAGSLNILFSDKTGTITKGKLEVIEFIDGDFNSYYNIESISNELQKLVLLSITQNNDSCYADGKIVGGNITDRALLKFSSNLKVSANVVDTIPFNSSLKYSQAKVKYNNQDYFLLKGAPEVILPKCNGYYDKSGTRRYLRSKIKVNEFISNKTYLGNRVLMLAIGKSVSDLTMVGIVLIKDEVRKEAIEGINLVKKAHIQTVMVTGDNKDTAICIAKEAGLYENGDLCITSDDLSRLHDEEVKKIIPRLKIVARAIPQDKSRLVRLSQEMDLVVGMTGDGVNDAPALKKADVGFAMGSGCEVAKEASDIVILDDNFLSIAKAILFGRTIFKSIRKFIIFQLTVNICAVSLSIIGPFIGIDTPVTVIQMLWINMVMDTLAALAFAYEPPLPEYMEEEPKKRDEPILNRYMRDEIIFTGAYSAILCVLFLKLPIFSELFREAENQKYLLTAFFGLFIFMGIFNSFNARTHRLNLFAHLFKNKVFIVIISFIAIVQVLLIYFGGDVFRTAGLSLKEFQIMFLLSLTVIPVDWVRKIILRKKGIIGGV